MLKQLYTNSLLLCALFIFLFSCAPSSKGDQVEEKPKASTTTSPYPPLKNEEITKLFEITDKVDIIFYDLPMSVNQDDAKSAKNTVLYISPAPAIISNPCKPLGRLSWISEGIIVKEADIYAGTGCQYLLFIQDNKPVAANAMSETGMQFFTNVLNQVQQKMK